MRVGAYYLVFVTLGCLSLARAQELPSFCGPPISPLFAQDLGDSYRKLSAPNGSGYCEGRLPYLAHVPPSEIVSVKQFQPPDAEFAKSGNSAITWCSDLGAQGVTQIRLRSLGRPDYGLDAEQAGRFEWASDRIANVHPKWADFAALGTQTAKVQNQDRTVVVPLRLGEGYSTTYSFLISSEVKLAKALIEWPGGGRRQTKVVEPRPAVLDADKTIAKTRVALWEVTLSFSEFGNGVFRLSFNDGNRTAKAIYLSNGCRIPTDPVKKNERLQQGQK